MKEDELLLNNLNKLKLSLGDILNIYFTYKKIKKGCYIDVKKKLSNNFSNILIEYKLKYKKYVGDNESYDLYFISKKIDPKNIDFIKRNKSLNHIEIGEFLGYGCIHNLKDNPCVEGYSLNIVYIEENKNKKIVENVYQFCCLKIDINIINNTLEIIHKMNYFLKKYLSKKLKGYIELSIKKLKDIQWKK
jgi:hypothetical protein